MNDRADLMDIALRLQECKRLAMSKRFVPLRVVLDKATDLVALYQDQESSRPPKTLDPFGPVDDF